MVAKRRPEKTFIFRRERERESTRGIKRDSNPVLIAMNALWCQD